MDPMLLRLFQTEIEMQCHFVVAGSFALDRGLSLDSPTARHFETWRALEEILIGAANISKLCWGSGGKREAARQPLRDSIAIDNTSCLYAPSLRNDFEHFDERLELWFRDDPNHIHVGRAIGNPLQLHIEGGTPNQRFGSFDPATGKAVFWDNEESIKDIIDEVVRILRVVQPEVAKPYWEP